MSDYDWLVELREKYGGRIPKGKWARSVMSKHPNMNHDDLYAEVLSFIEWLGER